MAVTLHEGTTFIVSGDGGDFEPTGDTQGEQAIRNYDPCISCSTHFLTLRVVEAR